MNFDPAGGVFSGTPPQDFSGTLSFRLIGSDGIDEEDIFFDLSVGDTSGNSAPVEIYEIPDQTVAPEYRLAIRSPGVSF